MAHPGSVTEFQLELIQLLGLDQERCIGIDLHLKVGELPTLHVETIEGDLGNRVEEWTSRSRHYVVTGIGQLAEIQLVQNQPEDNDPLQQT